jgi:GNAT superfamily N-acetyltransferase
MTGGPVVRATRPGDEGTILGLIRELAEFEALLHEVRATEADIRRDGFGAQPRFECLLAELDGDPVGFALFFHNYSTFEGRAGLYLEDVYVRPAARGRGVGRALMRALARTAVERGCARFELSVLHWNPARSFYGELGFTQMADWLPYRLTGDALTRLAEEGEG